MERLLEGLEDVRQGIGGPVAERVVQVVVAARVERSGAVIVGLVVSSPPPWQRGGGVVAVGAGRGDEGRRVVRDVRQGRRSVRFQLLLLLLVEKKLVPHCVSWAHLA